MDELDLGKVNYTQSSQRQWQDIWLWHYQLGHPSSNYLQHLFQSLFKNLVLSSLKCKNYILGKSHRTTYPISYNKCDALFEIIHSNLWEPVPITTTASFRWFVTFIDIVQGPLGFIC